MLEAKIHKQTPPSRSAAIRTKLSSNSGFTLIEMLVVTAIIGVLALMSLSAFTDVKDRARNVRTASEIRGLEKDITAFNTEKGYFPNQLSDLPTQHAETDPWGIPYEYKKYTITLMRFTGADVELNADYDLYSKGRDGSSVLSINDAASKDDVVRLRDGIFVGTVAQYLN